MIIEINNNMVIDTNHIIRISNVYSAINNTIFNFDIYYSDGRYSQISNKDECKLRSLRFELLRCWSDKIKQIKFY